MFATEMRKMLLTSHSTFRLKEKQEERGVLEHYFTLSVE
jgi:hypothetical protein